MDVALRLKITGMVHGVAFRATMAELAKSENVVGWVRNDIDGSVEAFLEGDEESVRRIVEWARGGPPRARVDSIDVRVVPRRNLKGFRIMG